MIEKCQIEGCEQIGLRFPGAGYALCHEHYRAAVLAVVIIKAIKRIFEVGETMLFRDTPWVAVVDAQTPDACLLADGSTSHPVMDDDSLCRCYKQALGGGRVVKYARQNGRY